MIEASQEGKRRSHRRLKKINKCHRELSDIHNSSTGKLRFMFRDEAGFGRINKPKYCWCLPGVRLSVPCHHIREYRCAYSAVEPITGESFFLVMLYCNTECMNIFLEELSKAYPNDHILLIADGASWHKSKTLVTPGNTTILPLPPLYTRDESH